MRLRFPCPQCERRVDVEAAAGDTRLDCPHCQAAWSIPPEALDEQGPRRCVVCPGAELYLKKDFPQKVGAALVVTASIASLIAWYYYYFVAAFGILFVMAALDLALALTMPELLVCYRCGAQYRGLSADDLRRHERFDLEVNERYRQEKARAPAPSHDASGP